MITKQCQVGHQYAQSLLPLSTRLTVEQDLNKKEHMKSTRFHMKSAGFHNERPFAMEWWPLCFLNCTKPSISSSLCVTLGTHVSGGRRTTRHNLDSKGIN